MGKLQAIKDSIFGPRTIQVAQITNPCDICESPNVVAEMYLDSDGQPDLMVVKCPKCGPIKKLYPGYRNRPQPRFERNYAEALTGQFQKPKSKKEV